MEAELGYDKNSSQYQGKGHLFIPGHPQLQT